MSPQIAVAFPDLPAEEQLRPEASRISHQEEIFKKGSIILVNIDLVMGFFWGGGIYTVLYELFRHVFIKHPQKCQSPGSRLQ